MSCSLLPSASFHVQLPHARGKRGFLDVLFLAGRPRGTPHTIHYHEATTLLPYSVRRHTRLLWFFLASAMAIGWAYAQRNDIAARIT